MSDAFEREPIFWAYGKWHYGQGLRELFAVSGNFLWFVSNFFSFKLLLKTLFSPWKRLGESYGGVFEFEKFASALVVNSMMRVVGFVTKLIVLLVGLVTYLVVCIFALFVLLIWILAPFILLGSLVLSATFFVI